MIVIIIYYINHVEVKTIENYYLYNSFLRRIYRIAVQCDTAKRMSITIFKMLQ